MLKTLEEPPAFVHLILFTDALGRVLETVVSRCQLVRFDPLPAEQLAEELRASGMPAERAPRVRAAGARQRRARALPRIRRRARRCGPTSRRSCGTRSPARRRPRTSRGARCSRAPRSAARQAEEARRRSAPSGSSSSRRGATGEALERELEEAAKRERPPRAHRGAGPGLDARRAGVPRPRLRGRGRRRRRARAPTASPALAAEARGARPAPAARRRRALRGDARVARAERDRGPGAAGADVPATPSGRFRQLRA